MSLIRNTSWSAIAAVTNAVTRLLVAVVAARRLGPETFGAFVFFQWLVDMSFLVFSAGLPGAATRFLPQSVGARGIPGFNRWFRRRGLWVVALASSGATGAAVIFGDGDASITGAVALWAAAHALCSLFVARAMGLFCFRRVAVSAIVYGCTVLALLLILPIASSFRDVVVALALGQLLAAACVSVRFTSADDTAESLGPADSVVVRNYARNSWLTSVSAYLVWGRGEISIVKGHLGASGVGLYSVGLTIAGSVNQAVGLLTGALTPRIARAWDRGDWKDVANVSGVLTSLTLLVSGLAAGLVMCFAPQIVIFLFGEGFLDSTAVLVLLGLGSIGLTSGSANLLMQTTTNGRFPRNITIVAGVTLLASAFSLIPLFGLEGAALARASIQLGVAFVTLRAMAAVLGAHGENHRQIRSFLLVSTAAGALALLMIARPDLGPTPRLVLFGTYGFVVVAVCTLGWTPAMWRELRRLSRLRYA